MKKPRVLVLCKHNSRRSQLVDAVLRDQAGDRIPVVSAGAFPQPGHRQSLWIAFPLSIQTVLIFAMTYGLARLLNFYVRGCGAFGHDRGLEPLRSRHRLIYVASPW